MPIGPKKMPFVNHLGELRHRLVVIVLTIGIGACVAYMFTGSIMDWLFAPVTPYLNDHALNVFGPFELFLFRFKVATYAALVLTSPIWVYQVLAFFLPALKENERKYFLPSFLAVVTLFIAGVMFCHYMVLGVSFQWLMSQGGNGIDVGQIFYQVQLWLHQYIPAINPVQPTPMANPVKLQTVASASQFLNGVAVFMIAFGLVFELPVLLFFLIGSGLVKYHSLRKNWRYVYLGLIVFGSLATPDWSPITIGLMIGVSVALYEATMLLARFVFASRIKEQSLEAAGAS